MLKNNIGQILKSGGVGIIATDTIYGLVAPALDQKAVERVYKVRKRNPNKACIILISSLKDLAKFDIKISSEDKKILNRYWPDKVSIILPCPNQQFKYLHRGTKTLAFRLPDNQNLIKLLKKTGPLIAPSANPEGLPPAKTISEAKKYFGNQIDFYQAGRTNKKPSRLVKVENGKEIILRK